MERDLKVISEAHLLPGRRCHVVVRTRPKDDFFLFRCTNNRVSYLPRDKRNSRALSNIYSELFFRCRGPDDIWHIGMAEREC